MTGSVLYLWGKDRASGISGESIALEWYLKSKALREVEIVFANNTDISPLGRLPVLKVCSNGDYIHGFLNIVDYLEPKRKDEFTDMEKLMELSAMSMLDSNLKTLNEYQLYLDKNNYITFTRKELSQLLYFPFNFNAAYEYRNRAKEQCVDLEYLPVEEKEDENEDDGPADYELAQSKTFALRGLRKRQRAEELKSIRLNRNYMHKLLEFLDQWDSITDDLPKTSPVPILYYSYMYIQLVILPNNNEICKYLKEMKSNGYVDTLKETFTKYNALDFNLNVREPVFRERGDLISTLLNKISV